MGLYKIKINVQDKFNPQIPQPPWRSPLGSGVIKARGEKLSAWPQSSPEAVPHAIPKTLPPWNRNRGKYLQQLNAPSPSCLLLSLTSMCSLMCSKGNNSRKHFIQNFWHGAVETSSCFMQSLLSYETGSGYSSDAEYSRLLQGSLALCSCWTANGIWKSEHTFNERKIQ